ncbi:hypothetical protein Aperf_G00000088875 [Anoplocephala perfoliata]
MSTEPEEVKKESEKQTDSPVRNPSNDKNHEPKAKSLSKVIRTDDLIALGTLIAAQAGVNVNPSACGPSSISIALIEAAVHGANPSAVLPGGNTALHWAAARGYLECLGESDVRTLPKQRPAGKREMYAALSRAALVGDVRAERFLIKHGADLTLKDDEMTPPLHAAIYGDQGVMVEVLLANEADVEVTNHGGYRPLMEAAKKGHLDIAKCLLLFGADLNAVSEYDQETTLSLATKADHNRECILLYKFKLLQHVM